MIYNLFCFIIWLISLPFLVILAFKKKYRKSIPARFFLFKNPPFKPCDVHFHACSLGEVNSIINLASKFDKIALTTTTQTGFNKAVSSYKESRFLPFELFLPLWLKKSKVLVVFEAELWLNLVRYAKKNGSYVILLNARISDKSYKRYKKFSFYYKKIFNNIDLVLAQSELDEERLKELGARCTKVVGNVKSANFTKPSKNYAKFSQKLIVIASTHEGEEEKILSNLEFKDDFKIILAPRHPERFNQVDEICKEYTSKLNISYEKFSSNLELKSDFILLDTLGELVNFYKIADVVVLGGSFIKGVGGHNPIEIAQFNTPLINGEFIDNQKALFCLVEGVNFSNLSNLNELLNMHLNPTNIVQMCDIKAIENIIKEKI
ncbi:lipid IV(A) 3-deoxy-D-manno-octulosonic acid transferase [Campylobacter geochelonis]|uniref:lipid IV(A) 3-deoxy-D-manno-octulosonic acid transferase n=1 Tax=Campylobacter geochelonis TaxID=1780362 RepID=UPI0007708BD4|nr:lipid IV(A) 3-deoxy-D-manno-octulosonic acid transferase [Campylobacter geochelonis]CZE49077.1 3-deoxy-D-manno-octulosonic-acid transferase [Campylobacter geochelonis]